MNRIVEFSKKHSLGMLKVLGTLGVFFPTIGAFLLIENQYILGGLAIGLALAVTQTLFSLTYAMLKTPLSIFNQLQENNDLQNNLENMMNQLLPGLAEALGQMGDADGDKKA